jgi:hypothetical protein
LDLGFMYPTLLVTSFEFGACNIFTLEWTRDPFGSITFSRCNDGDVNRERCSLFSRGDSFPDSLGLARQRNE